MDPYHYFKLCFGLSAQWVSLSLNTWYQTWRFPKTKKA